MGLAGARRTGVGRAGPGHAEVGPADEAPVDVVAAEEGLADAGASDERPATAGASAVRPARRPGAVSGRAAARTTAPTTARPAGRSARRPAPRPHLLGVRHHGPGSARAVAAALTALAPDIVLIEGPPEADLLLSYAADPGMRPPVALLAHAADDPAQAGFWPYAEFSPEWVAIRYALDKGVPVRFIDLPAGCTFALDRARADAADEDEPDADPASAPAPRADPIAALAHVAGHDDPERWWEDAVEHHTDHTDHADPMAPFALLAEAMAELRASGAGSAATLGAHEDTARQANVTDGHTTGRPLQGSPAMPGRGTASATGEGANERGAADADSLAAPGHDGVADRDGSATGPVREGRWGATAQAAGAHHTPSPSARTGPAPDGLDTQAGLAAAAGRDTAGMATSRATGLPGVSPASVIPASATSPSAAPASVRPGSRAVGSVATADLPGLEAAREAHMRLAVATAYRQGFREVAVVCGAWHVPALVEPRPAAEDRAVLAPFGRGGALPRVKVETTWVPWTHRRLAHASGYGAGVASPGWYGHLFAAADRPRETLLPSWFVRIAELFRDAGRPVSPAHVIEAVRHAEALAMLRGRPLAGLDETLEAVRAVMCDGEDAPLALVVDDIVVGDRIGTVPDGVPAVPLQRDLTREQNRLRLKPEAAPRELELDLRKPVDADRSRLLTRLDLLDVPWGVPSTARRGTGTFREAWSLHWQPELAIRVAEAGVWGTTVAAAATNRAAELAYRAESLADVTAVAEQCLRADLPDALPLVMRVLEERAALHSDVAGMAQALPALVRALRYGDVRGTDTAALATVVEGLLLRVCVGLVPACAGLDADGARDMCRRVDEVHDAVRLLAAAREPARVAAAAGGAGGTGGAGGAGDSEAVGGSGGAAGPTRPPDSTDDLREHWYAALVRLADRPAVPGLLTGRAVRLLLDGDRLTAADAAPRLARALTRGTPYRDAAAWVEGFLSGGGLLLVHDEDLLALVDDWVAGIPPEDFTDVLPLLRRTFASFAAPERRTLGERLRAPAASAARRAARDTDPLPFDPARADAALPLVAYLLGAPTPPPRTGPAEVSR
ncbi:DUF5682 family protein [Yinghuangia seranimata]|uniref:DUF5682 family protein n=1 Tax=Yinghuangia seranimata TaxID=408067 RepID=UPI00248B4C02|nr:DUF5682 family protein [Yinghuangia seranimata]MDI2126788.1 DUF5682 family protein [Yinghuangia seranimata]